MSMYYHLAMTYDCHLWFQKGPFSWLPWQKTWSDKRMISAINLSFTHSSLLQKHSLLRCHLFPFSMYLPLLNFESSITQFANSHLTENYSLISSHIKQRRTKGKLNSPWGNIPTTFTFLSQKKVTYLDLSPISSPLLYSLSYWKKPRRCNILARSRQLEENHLHLAEHLFLPTATDLLLGKR